MSFQVFFVLCFLFAIAGMKFASWYSYPPSQRGTYLSFLFSPTALSLKPKDRPYEHSLSILVLKFVLTIGALIVLVMFIRSFLLPLTYWRMLYISPLVYLLTECVGTFGQIIFFKGKVPPLHFHPLKSKSLAEFWGRRWNVWVQDWLRDVSGHRRRSLHYNIVVTFLISGFFHEIMFNLPYSLYTKTFFFGNMFLYFAIQGLGLWLEKKFLKGRHPRLRYIYLWLVVVLPSPIFMKGPFLLFLGINNG